MSQRPTPAQKRDLLAACEREGGAVLTKVVIEDCLLREGWAARDSHGIVHITDRGRAAVGRATSPAEVDKPTPAEPLNLEVTTPATMFDPELTYFADGTPVTVHAHGEDRQGTAAGRVPGPGYAFQVVRWADGTTSNIAPHVISPRQQARVARGDGLAGTLTNVWQAERYGVRQTLFHLEWDNGQSATLNSAGMKLLNIC